MKYQPAIGLEIHIELSTQSKMFCACKNDSEEKNPNTNICPVCTAQPGTLPVINEEALRKVIKTGLALNCQIPEFSKFDRKNYFYPDLPKGYQISQYDKPLCLGGFLNVDGQKIRITRVHLEEDTGSLIHKDDYSLVDFNRAGVPLMELVTEPDITSAIQAKKFAEELHLIMHYLNVSDADMEKGEMRVEVNISLSKDSKLGTKVEIKNLNSFRSVERAVDYEIKRQSDLLEKGEKIIQETRGWLDDKGLTFSQREKEEAHDYRYFPEPDLPPLHHSKEFINGIKAEIPELPAHRRERFKREYELDEKSVEIFVYNKSLGEYFEKVAKELPPNLVKSASDFLINTEVKNYNIPPKNFSQLIILIKDKKISNATAKEILPELVGSNPLDLIKKRGLEQVSDEKEIEKIAIEVISKNQKAVEDYKNGKTNVLQFLAGQIMAKTQGKANPQIVNTILKDLLTKTK
ncbi:MAG: Asp-tRNA(Asn)/Glu-tRNA(Gln) amidotransferase subunit GatB [Candidatus Nealsonbacteria bacterium]|nr:Asp-tRNA(Asn)/Glu-tRNA(Gln) amidotransferase subunit GatB [Candidatus Nealsonbacteria bacterium]